MFVFKYTDFLPTDLSSSSLLSLFFTLFRVASGVLGTIFGAFRPSDFTPAKNRILSILPKLRIPEPPPPPLGSLNVVWTPYPGGFGGPYPSSSRTGIFGACYFPFVDLREKSGFLIPTFIFSMSFFSNMVGTFLELN